MLGNMNIGKAVLITCNGGVNGLEKPLLFKLPVENTVQWITIESLMKHARKVTSQFALVYNQTSENVENNRIIMKK